MRVKYKVFDIDPVSKPRQTHSSRWKKTPADLKYYAFKDEVRLLEHLTIYPGGNHVVFVLKMPQYWSKKKKKEMLFKPHQQRPDVDNIGKALFDACFTEDSHIWDCRFSKIWGNAGKIILITEIETDWIFDFLREVL